MAVQRILLLGDPALRKVSEPVHDLQLAAGVMSDLEDTLREFRRTHGFGRGISAIQIGHSLRLIFMEVDGIRFELVNPEYSFLSAETFELWDDCFSFPDLLVRLRRSKALRLRYLTLRGESCQLEASGKLSELIQHEMDHLDGVLAVDRAIDKESLIVREEYVRRYTK